jgi:hypothetical protein
LLLNLKNAYKIRLKLKPASVVEYRLCDRYGEGYLWGLGKNGDRYPSENIYDI